MKTDTIERSTNSKQKTSFWVSSTESKIGAHLQTHHFTPTMMLGKINCRGNTGTVFSTDSSLNRPGYYAATGQARRARQMTPHFLSQKAFYHVIIKCPWKQQVHWGQKNGILEKFRRCIKRRGNNSPSLQKKNKVFRISTIFFFLWLGEGTLLEEMEIQVTKHSRISQNTYNMETWDKSFSPSVLELDLFKCFNKEIEVYRGNCDFKSPSPTRPPPPVSILHAFSAPSCPCGWPMAAGWINIADSLWIMLYIASQSFTPSRRVRHHSQNYCHSTECGRKEKNIQRLRFIFNNFNM